MEDPGKQDKSKKRKRTIASRLLMAQKNLVIDPSYNGDQVVAACRQALHDQGLLVKRDGFGVRELGGSRGLVAMCNFSLQGSDSNEEVSSTEMACAPNADSVRYALAAMWEEYLRDLLLLPKFPGHAPPECEAGTGTERGRAYPEEVPVYDDSLGEMTWMRPQVQPASNKVVGVFVKK